MTLRVRLLLGLVVLAAIGLAVAGGLTYRQTRADLVSRVNGQLASASQSPTLFFSRIDRGPDDGNPSALQIVCRRRGRYGQVGSQVHQARKKL